MLMFYAGLFTTLSIFLFALSIPMSYGLWRHEDFMEAALKEKGITKEKLRKQVRGAYIYAIIFAIFAILSF